ncbi:hypothetical protein Tco_1081821 [Tanacetum coccineum]|uniref:Uncharacterized protein n=1 Tax=Tanacetum coccineum TaxID=301880 RepID=A0ABQ5HYP1_9ASTR
MLAPGNYNPPSKFKWTEKTVLVVEGSLETTTEGYMENYKNVSYDIRDQLNAEAKAVAKVRKILITSSLATGARQVLLFEYTRIEVKHFKDTLLQHMGNVKKSVAERTRHQRQYDRRVNKRQMQTQESKIDTGKAVDDDLVVTESSGTKSAVQDDYQQGQGLIQMLMNQIL